MQTLKCKDLPGKMSSAYYFRNFTCYFSSFNVQHTQKRLLAKICYYKRYRKIQIFIHNSRAFCNLVTPILMRAVFFEELVLNLVLLNFDDFIKYVSLTFSFSISSVNFCITHAENTFHGMKYSSIELANSSKCMEFLCFSSRYIKISDFSHIIIIIYSLI